MVYFVYKIYTVNKNNYVQISLDHMLSDFDMTNMGDAPRMSSNKRTKTITDNNNSEI